jgi:Domain of unknown function (DUF5666)
MGPILEASTHSGWSAQGQQETSMTANPTDPGHGAAFSGATGGPSRRRIGLVLGGAAVLVVAVVATSFAAGPSTSNASNGGSTPFTLGGLDPALDGTEGPGLGRFGAHGFREITITAISGNDITLGTPDGWRRTITITSSVELTKGGQDIAVSDLAVGDQVRFRQTRNDDGSFTVTAVAVVVPTIKGTVSDLTSTGFKVTTRDGSVWTIAVNGSTTYSYGQGSGTLADVKDGGAVRVQGTVTADNQMTATNVRVAGDRAVGTVTAKTADTITIQRRDGTSLTIHVDGDTTYRVAGVEDADLGDVTVGMAIGVTGRARSDGSIDADAVAGGGLRGLGRDGGKGRAGFDGPGLVLPDLADPIGDEEIVIPIA